MITKSISFFSDRFRILSLTVGLFMGMVAFAQQKVVTGKVIDDNTGDPLPGVTIVEAGTSNGTITNIDGEYSLSLRDGAQITVSFIGFVTQTIAVGKQTQVEVSLVTDTKTLDEVVVVGYGTSRRSDLTGAIVSVSGDDLKKVPVATVAETLTGRLAGVQVTATEGSPDAAINIRVRGSGSITQDASPLFIVDGFPVSTISDISPSDIKSIDVLKDASSTAIYGSRGSNGVIIITTKSGTTDGKMSVSLNTFYGQRKIANTLDVLSPSDYAQWQYEYALLDNPNDLSSYESFFGTFQDLGLYEGVQGNDWQRQVYGRTGEVFSTDISLRGGTNKTNYSANFARYDDKAIQIGSDFLRNNFTFKLNNKPLDKVQVAFSLRYSDTQINGGGANEQNEVSSADSRLRHSVGYSPLPISGITTNADDTDPVNASFLVNPIRSTNDNNREQFRRNLNLGGAVTWNITDQLKFRTDVGVDNLNYQDSRFYGVSTFFVRNRPQADLQNLPAVRLRDRKTIRLRNTNTLTYDFKNILKNGHGLQLLVGQEFLDTQVEQLTSEVHGFPTDFLSDDAFKLTTQGTPFSTDNNFSPDDRLLSFFSRANYDLKGRYLLSATFRADGSSKFLGDNQWGYFPSVAAAWKISEENFMQQSSSWLNSLKVRASYGEAGNNNIPTGQTLPIFQSRNSAWINDVESFWTPPTTLANPDLKWETTITRNIGLDFDLFQGLVSGSVEAYQNSTSDLLIRARLLAAGYQDQFRNLGEIENKGLETSLKYYAIDKEKYGLNFSFNISFNRNEIISLGGESDFGQPSGWASTQIGNDFVIEEGGAVGQMYGYLSDGRYEVSDFDYNPTDGYTLRDGVADASQIVGEVGPGRMKLKDLNGDGLVTIDDQQIIGNANPKHVGGFVLNGYAYGFDLTAAFNWSYGNDIYNANKVEFTTANQNSQYRNLISLQSAGTRWTHVDPQTGERVTDPTQLAALNANTSMWSPYMDRYVFSDWAVEDGSFLRLNTLTLGYTLPTALVSKYWIKSLRFYTTAYNVFVITNYTGYDPEVSTRRRTPLTPGVDSSAYPRSRMVVVGLNLTF